MIASAPCGGILSKNRETPQIAFPKGWTKQVRSVVLHVICRIEKENGIMMRYVWCNLIVMLTATAAPAASYFVAVDGQAGNDGSHAKPWPTVEFALSKVGTGNTIIVRPGVYRGPWQIRNHPAEPGGSPTIIQSEVKWKAVVNGGEGAAINVVDCPGIVLDGFEVSGARGQGISMNTDLGTVRNCWVHANGKLTPRMLARIEQASDEHLGGRSDRPDRRPQRKRVLGRLA